MRRALCVGMLSLLLSSAGSSPSTAEQIRLKDGTELTGTIRGRDAHSVVVEVPRAAIEMVDGKPLSPPVAIGTNAPDFEAVDVAGTKHRLAAYRGRAVLLKFWATWCPHCRADVSLISELFDRYRDKGLQVLTVSVDQDLTKLRTFIKEHGLRYPIIAAYDDAASASQRQLPDLYETQGIPAYVVIDTHGMVAQVFSGSITEGPGAQEFEEGLARLLQNAKPQAAKTNSKPQATGARRNTPAVSRMMPKT